ncbi:flagellar biosynthesis/type III secretory pathway chaperone [Planomicrobium koreense]|uniref:Flagellar biosynthesis/type III secretory pathway chaperone n=1 Tax=Planococcus koreensis TaxID=112331 RepID=A0A7W8FTZ7_9BACL|nr:flagellar protein FlgN [Planococcus koreensis]MBB5179317.1 flagellar biosynthesis/type III secretory pathway chaperone [Planococcus koreensis]
MLNRLGVALEELIEIQKQLIDYAEQKRVVLIERRVDELNVLVKDEAKLVKQLNVIEAERERVAIQLMEQYGADSFSGLVDGLPDELMKRKLQTQVKTLQGLLVELQAKNQINERLLLDSMHFVQHMIDQVTKTKQQHFNYQSPIGNQKPQTSSQGFFDTKA